MLEGLTSQARHVLERATQEARALCHASVGPEHVLLGLVEEHGATATALTSVGLEASGVRDVVDWVVGGRGPIPDEHPISLSDRACRVVVRGLALAREVGSACAGPDHLLLALSLESPSIVAGVMEDLGVDIARVGEEAIARLAGDDPGAVARYEELVDGMLEAQAARRGQVLDPFADEPPDLVDGLLEADRQVLGALRARYSVSRRIVGGDPLLYARLLRMARDWVLRYPLAEGHGNFGSIDGFEAANMEFTEARRSTFVPEAHLIPLLLVNGAPGIPPHNLAEVTAATVAYIDDPEISTSELLGHLPGPDFPTGGVVVKDDSLPPIYETGRGTIILRGRAHVEPRPAGDCLVITEIPYGIRTIQEGGLIEQIAEAVRRRKIDGVSDLEDHSREETGMRLVLELAPAADADIVLHALYAHTDLQTSYPVRLAARVDGKARTLTLRELIGGWVAARLADQSKHELREQLIGVAERHHDARRTTLT
jgi:DNA gyrase/topoisomerase IV, subunit A/Clp amino terminal domain, pathogenicity island component